MVTAVVVLAGTIATMAYPMLRTEMHLKVEGLVPLTALELAGRHVPARGLRELPHADRPTAAERGGPLQGEPPAEPSGRYSLAGEFAYDHPFLWGSKRTGPDLAFEGWLKSGLAVRALRGPAGGRAAFQHARVRVPEGAPGGRGRDAPHARAPHAGCRTRTPISRAPPGSSRARPTWTRSSRTCCRSGRRSTAAGRGRRDRSRGAEPARHRHRGDREGQALRGAGLRRVSRRRGARPGGRRTEPHRRRVPRPEGRPARRGLLRDDQGRQRREAAARPAGLADGGMQAYGSELSDEDIWSIVAWLRNQKGHEA